MATHCKEYDFLKIEPFWQTFWEENATFLAGDARDRPKYYALDMFPYPSGAGLHIGHPEGYTATDIISRYKRAKGFNVLHPIGWDAFGLPAEQHAVKTGTHPATNTQNNIKTFRRQLKALGFSYDWEREVDTTDPKYFRWTQWIFLQLFKRGLAYVDERPVWWCPELKTVLANEEVIDGKSEVGGFPVERRNLRQWVLRITAYADRLLSDLKDVDWPESTKRMQEAWIGRSEGTEVFFALEQANLGSLQIYTTRVDTLFGCTFMVLAPEHPLVAQLTTESQQPAIDAYKKTASSKSDLERTDLAKDKSGVFTGSYAINPVNGARIPIWVADYVLMGYGTGAIMAVPAHDDRDYEFAIKYQLPVIQVLAPNSPDVVWTPPDAPTNASLVNSGNFNGLDWITAKNRISSWLEGKNLGRPSVQYKLRDWLFSRQRYWGEPFPIVWVQEDAYEIAKSAAPQELPEQPVAYTMDGVRYFALPVRDAALPLQLPEVKSYLPSGTGESPLAHETNWLEIWYHVETGASVPAVEQKPDGPCWVRGRRETNTMPQWAGSCWYYLRFTDPKNGTALADPAALAYWGVPDLYIGGTEHAVLHLLYARFWHKVLYDIGAVPQSEPFKKLFHQGIILGEDGEKMSKSRGNVVNPDSVIADYGADTLRLYEMFLGPLEATKPWNPQGIEGVHRFLKKIWRECLNEDGLPNAKVVAGAEDSPELTRLLHETIKKVGDDIESLRLNTAISQMMILSNAIQKAPRVSKDTILSLLKLLSPFAPHITEELWARLGEKPSILFASWPDYDVAKLIVTEDRLVVQINGKFRGDCLVPAGLDQNTAQATVMKLPKIAALLASAKVKKVIYVRGKIINFVLE